MGKKFRVGDKVKVVGMSPVTFAPSVKDELGTEKLFKSMVGKVYTVRGFDKYGNVELQPKRLNALGRARIFETARKKAHPEISFVHMPGKRGINRTCPVTRLIGSWDRFRHLLAAELEHVPI
jgi:hypothetical protein